MVVWCRGGGLWKWALEVVAKLLDSHEGWVSVCRNYSVITLKKALLYQDKL